jgi:hypothetical protein
MIRAAHETVKAITLFAKSWRVFVQALSALALRKASSDDEGLSVAPHARILYDLIVTSRVTA